MSDLYDAQLRIAALESGGGNRKRLTELQVASVRRMSKLGVTNRKIADHFAVNPSSISRIVAGKAYR